MKESIFVKQSEDPSLSQRVQSNLILIFFNLSYLTQSKLEQLALRHPITDNREEERSIQLKPKKKKISAQNSLLNL